MGRAPEVFCICRQPDDGTLMIQCNFCDEWFHIACVGVGESEVDTLKEYRCLDCTKKGQRASAGTTPKKAADPDEAPYSADSSDTDGQDDGLRSEAVPSRRKRPSVSKTEGGSKKPTLSYDEEADSARKTVVEGLTHALSLYYEQWEEESRPNETEQDNLPPWRNVADVAQAIEREMFTQLAETTPQMHGESFSRCGTAYKAKYRTLQFNLKDPKNQSLREAIFRGTLPVVRLVSMPPADMANEEVAREIKSIRAQSLSRVVLEEEGTLELVRKTNRPASGTAANDFVPPEAADLVSSTDPYLNSRAINAETDEVDNSHNVNVRDHDSAIGNGSPPAAGEEDLEWNDEWYGKIYLPDWEVKRLAAFAKFLGHSRRLPGWGSRELKRLLPHNLHCSGRLDRERAAAYINSLWSGSSSRDVILFAVISPPALGGELTRLVAHLEEASRWAVVAHDPGRGMRDFYLAPLASETDRRLFPAEAPLPTPAADVLVGVVVVARDGSKGTAVVDDTYDPESK